MEVFKGFVSIQFSDSLYACSTLVLRCILPDRLMVGSLFVQERSDWIQTAVTQPKDNQKVYIVYCVMFEVLPDRLMVGQEPLKLLILVRFQAWQPILGFLQAKRSYTKKRKIASPCFC